MIYLIPFISTAKTVLFYSSRDKLLCKKGIFSIFFIFFFVDTCVNTIRYSFFYSTGWNKQALIKPFGKGIN